MDFVTLDLDDIYFIDWQLDLHSAEDRASGPASTHGWSQLRDAFARALVRAN